MSRAPSLSDGAVTTLLKQRDLFLRFLSARVGNVADAEDILQDSLAKALRRADSLRRSDRVVPWFYRVLRNAIADFYRSKKAKERQANTILETLKATGDDTAISAPNDWEAAVCRCFVGLLPTLKQRYAELLTRIDLRGEPKVVVRHELKLRAAAFDVALHRARNALRKQLEVFCGACSREACLRCACEQQKRPSKSRRS